MWDIKKNYGIKMEYLYLLEMDMIFILNTLLELFAVEHCER